MMSLFQIPIRSRIEPSSSEARENCSPDHLPITTLACMSDETFDDSRCPLLDRRHTHRFESYLHASDSSNTRRQTDDDTVTLRHQSRGSELTGKRDDDPADSLVCSCCCSGILSFLVFCALFSRQKRHSISFCGLYPVATLLTFFLT
jgi:hypothetical protein